MADTPKPFGWAILGTGAIARWVAPELLGAGGRIVAVWNRTPAKAAAFVQDFGGTVCPTPEAAVTAPGVEGVYIALTADQHAEAMLLCIAHGKPVLCEKPFTANARQARAVFAAAARTGVYVAEAMWTWYNSPALTCREWVRSGAIGRVQSADLAFLTPLLLGEHLPRLMDPDVCGGALLDLGIYPLRYCYELFGLPRAVHCTGRLQNGCDLGQYTALEYEGFTARLHTAFDHPRNEEWCHITGTEGCIDAPDFHAASRLTLAVDGRPPRLYVDETPKYGRQFAAVAAEIRAGARESTLVPARGTVDCMALLDECRRQMGIVYPCEQT